MVKECVNNLDQTNVTARSPANKQPSSSQLVHACKEKVPLAWKIHLVKPSSDARGTHQDTRVRVKSLSVSLSVRRKHRPCGATAARCGLPAVFLNLSNNGLSTSLQPLVPSCARAKESLFYDGFPDEGVDKGVGGFPGNDGGLPGGSGILSLHLSPTLLASPLCLLTFRLSREALCNFPKWLIYL